MHGRTPTTLVRMLTVRMMLVAATAAVLLLAFFMAHYLRSPAELSQQTLEAQATTIATALANGQNPAQWPLYRDRPDAYGFRAFDKALPAGQRLLGQANAALLPPLPAPLPTGGAEQIDPVLRLRERFEEVPQPNGTRTANHWMLTSRHAVGGRGIWVQTVMLGDPQWLWMTALSDEMLVHVAVPVGVLVPTMTLAMLLVMRRALRPLESVARQTHALSRAAARGVALPPLSQNGLTRELVDLVGSVNTMLAKLDTALARERAFAADAAHELRTPLAVLRLQVAELPKGPVAKRMDEELATLAHLVGQLLRFAQAEEVMATERRIVDVTAVARTTCEELAPTAATRQQELAFSAPEQPVMMSGNPTLLSVALRNLVENALRATPPGGLVTVSVGPDGMVVEDNGPGVPDTHKPYIFDRLWQAERRREGAGIGLALVRRVAQLHDAAVWVEDRPGGGARFVLQLSRPPGIVA